MILLESTALVLLIVFLIYTIRHFVFVFSSISNKVEDVDFDPNYSPFVSILIPCHNEEAVIGGTLRGLLAQDYPKNKLEIIVINDASIDATGVICDEISKNTPQVKVVHRSKGGNGKSAALNSVLRSIMGEIVLCFDADYVPCSSDLIRRLIRHFKDPKVGAVQGNVVVFNKNENIITRMVYLERVGGYEIELRARGLLNIPAQYGGTVGGFRRNVLEEIGFWSTIGLASLTEDTESTFKAILKGYKIKYDVTAECYEEAVSSIKRYYHQRKRWATGHQACFFKYWKIVLKSKMPIATKIDSIIVLGFYFVPLFSFLALILTAVNQFEPIRIMQNTLVWWGILLWMFGTVGNLAPVTSILTGLWLKKDFKSCIFVIFLPFMYLVNVIISINALYINLTKKEFVWVKTKKEGYISTAPD